MGADETIQIQQIIHTVYIGFEARESSVHDTLQFGGDKHIVEAVDNWMNGSFHSVGWFGVHMNAVDVGRLVHAHQESFELFNFIID